jgi:hypothetical protein
MVSFHITALGEDGERSELIEWAEVQDERLIVAASITVARGLSWIERALPMSGVEIRLLKCNREKEEWRWIQRPLQRKRGALGWGIIWTAVHAHMGILEIMGS